MLSPGQRGDIKSAQGLLEPLPPAAALLGDTAYDGNALRGFLTERGTTPVIKPNPTRKLEVPFDPKLYKARNTIERAFAHIKDWRRVATRYDKLARNYQATVALAAIVLWWTN
jgi:transposase